MVSIDIGDLKEEISKLQDYLEKKLNVEVVVQEKVMQVGTETDRVARGKVKDYVERFFYRGGLSENFKVRSEKDTIKIVKQKTSGRRFSFSPGKFAALRRAEGQ